MTEINRKKDITTNGRKENTKHQQPDMAKRQPRLKKVTAGKISNRYDEWQLTKVRNVHFMYVGGMLVDLYT